MDERIFIDFDDVIFNTKAFARDFEKLFIDMGIPRDVYRKNYIDPDDDRAIKTFNPWIKARMINEVFPVDIEKINVRIESFLTNCSSKYIFEDVYDLIDSIGKNNISILSFGELELQGKKIRCSGIADHIGSIFIAQTKKSDIIASMVERGEIDGRGKLFFIDDRVEQIEEVKKRFPEIVTIFLKRPEGRYQEMMRKKCCDHQVSDLVAATEIINDDCYRN